VSVLGGNPLLIAGDDAYQISRSVRLRASATAYFNRTPAGAGNQQKWTWSGWVKRGSFGQQQLFSAGAGTGGSPECYIDFEDNLNFQIFDGTSNLAVVRSTAVYRDPSAWYHVVVAIDTTQATAANRVLLYINGQAITSFAFSTYPTQNLNTQVNAATAHRISSSTRISAYYFDGYLTEVNFIDGQALTPSSFGETDVITGVWKAKKYAGTYGTNGFYLPFKDPSSTTSLGYDWSLGYGAGQNSLLYSEQFDNGSWGKARCSVSANATTAPNGTATADKIVEDTTASNSHYIYASTTYVSGSVYTSSGYFKAAERSKIFLSLPSAAFTTEQRISFDLSNGTYAVDGGSPTGAIVSVGNGWYRCSISATATASLTTNTIYAYLHLLTYTGDGTSGLFAWGAQLEASATATTYTPTTTVPAPNNWTPNNISLTAGVTYDSMIDVPTMYADGGNGRGNYAVLNPLKSSGTVLNGNLYSTNAGASGWYTTYATASMESGKYYWEFTVTDDNVNARFAGFGIAEPSIALTSIGATVASTPANNSKGWMQSFRSAISVYGTGLYNNGASVNTTTRATTSGDRNFMVAYDADTGKCWMGYEGSWWTGDPAAGTSPYFTAAAPMMPFFMSYNDGSNASLTPNVNFGQRPFTYTPPTGFKTLNTQNLPDATIKAGNKYFDATLYTGTGAVQSINNSGAFQPDLIWAKGRSYLGNNILFDSSRGANQAIFANLTNAEVTHANSVTSFNAGGFSVGADANNNVNKSAESLVAWQWKAGGAAVTNNAGSITSQVSAGAAQGFSVVTYTGNGSASQTAGHGLGVAPSFVIFKTRSTADDWLVYSSTLGASKYLILDSTAAAGTAAGYFSGMTSSVIGLGYGASSINGSGRTFVAYAFAEVAGYSKFGSYTANGSADGPFVYCGFRPRFILVKDATASNGNWNIVDTARSTYNLSTGRLIPNATDIENTGLSVDVLSNGFKVRVAVSDWGVTSGNTIIFAAFAENPFKNSLAR
jgi:hypothetical protein